VLGIDSAVGGHAHAKRKACAIQREIFFIFFAVAIYSRDWRFRSRAAVPG
jgi:hypothetical protein